MVERSPYRQYIGTSIKGSLLENTVWSDITRCLINPADLPDELLAESNDAGRTRRRRSGAGEW